MHIDTHTKETMEKSICDYLNIELEELIELFNKAPYKYGYLDKDRFIEIIDNFLNKHIPKIQINEILFFHLSRRLIVSSNDYIGYNLEDLLTTNNAMSTFLKKHQIEFIKEKENIALFYKKKKIEIDKESNESLYLKIRLGYNKQKDYCFNGFAFKDILYKNTYTRNLLEGPEFIQKLSKFLKYNDLCQDYIKNSKYFCYEYCVPIEQVLFDDNENMSIQQKQIYLLEQIILRLYNYSINCIFDDDNPILRLQDNDIMQTHFFIDKEEINEEMINKLY